MKTQNEILIWDYITFTLHEFYPELTHLFSASLENEIISNA